MNIIEERNKERTRSLRSGCEEEIELRDSPYLGSRTENQDKTQAYHGDIPSIAPTKGLPSNHSHSSSVTRVVEFEIDTSPGLEGQTLRRSSIVSTAYQPQTANLYTYLPNWDSVRRRRSLEGPLRFKVGLSFLQLAS